MRLEVASQFHLQLGPAAVGACRGQAYCLFVLGPLGQGVARLGPILPTVSLASSAVWCLLLRGKEKEAMSGVLLAIYRRLSPGCATFSGPVDDHDPEGAKNLWSDLSHCNSPRSLNWFLGLQGGDLMASPKWFWPQPIQNMPHAGEAPVCSLCTPTHASH